jgi:hypothetical protein
VAYYVEQECTSMYHKTSDPAPRHSNYPTMQIILLILLASTTHAARYGLLRIGGPTSAGKSTPATSTSQRSLFDEDVHA